MLTKEIIENDLRQFVYNVRRKRDYVGDLIVIKARGIKNCRLSLYRSRPRFDPLLDQDYGIIRPLFRTSYHREYKVTIGRNRDFDTLLDICINRDRMSVETVFAIKKEEIIEKSHITITENGETYKKFRVDEKPYTKIYDYIKTGKYSMLEDKDIIMI